MSETVLSWGLTYLLHSTILIGTIWVANLRIRSSFSRDLLWKIALVGGIVTATISTALPFELNFPWSRSSVAAEPVSLGISGSSQESPGTAPGDSLPMGDSTVAAAPQIVVYPGSLATAGAIIAATAPALFLLWLAGSALLAARLLIGHVHLMRRLRSREVIVTGEDFEILQALRALDSVRPVRLSTSGAVSSPIAMIGSEVVIPRDMFQRLSLAQRESILAHELAHVQRRDPLWLCLTELVCAILFLQPLNRLVRREMKETAEFLCDDAALRQTGDRRALAETLAELASIIPPVRASTVAAMAEGGSNLFRRVSRVLYEDGVADKPLRPSVRFAIVVLPLLLVTGLAPAIDARTDQNSDSMPTAEGAVIDVEAPLFAIAAPEEDQPAAKVSTTASAVGSGTHRADATFYATGSKARGGVVPHQRLSDAVLSQSFDGPEGATSVTMKAHAAEVALDGSWVRFFEADGFLRARQESDRGPIREVEITAGRNLEPKYDYRVDGETHDWCSDAERIVAASFLAGKAYDNWKVAGPKASGGGTVRTTSGTSRTTRSESRRPNWSDHLEWRANVEDETNTADGLHRVRIRASGVHYNPKTAEVWIDPDGRLDVTETRGGSERKFSRTADGVNWNSDSTWAAADDAARMRWLVEVLGANSSLPRAVIESLARD